MHPASLHAWGGRQMHCALTCVALLCAHPALTAQPWSPPPEVLAPPTLTVECNGSEAHARWVAPNRFHHGLLGYTLQVNQVRGEAEGMTARVRQGNDHK